MKERILRILKNSKKALSEEELKDAMELVKRKILVNYYKIWKRRTISM